jgi:GNAT superfamily N-acetyltransferase
MSEGAQIRDDAPDGPAARALFAEYMELVRARLGLPTDTVLPERIFANPEAFAGRGGAWLVVYDAGGEPVGCGGLRVLAPGVGEIKRMFVSERARGAGHGRRLLRELERRAAAGGLAHVRLLTTAVLSEARALYEAEGYREIDRVQPSEGPIEVWLEKAL